jgi:hypothetical protein
MEPKMKTLSISILIILLTGCTSKTQLGPCVGIGEQQNPKLVYKLDAMNLIMGLIFIEMIVPPVIVAVDETFCPVGVK